MSDSDENDIEFNENEYILNQIILPRYFPKQKLKYSDQMYLMHEMITSISNSSDWLPPKTVEFFKRFERVHEKIDVKTIADEIKSLRSSDTFALFVKHQKCTLIVHRMTNNTEAHAVIVATFPHDIKKSEIYKIDSDIEVN